jgi:CheY-like chemotaxis protein
MDVHVNDGILFIELAQGLNDDKLDILYYKIKELLLLYEVNIPRMIIMLSDINLNLKGGTTGGADVGKLEKLLRLVLRAAKAKRRILQLLTKDEHIRQFVAERREYAEYRAVSSLQEAMDLLYAGEKAYLESSFAEAAPAKAAAWDDWDADEEGAADTDADAEVLEDIADQVVSKGTILNADDPKTDEVMLLRFDKDHRNHLTTEALREFIRNLRIGAVDDDSIILELIRNIFETLGASVKTYANGAEFLREPEKALFDLVFLDLIMPEVDGFAVLQQLQVIKYQTPVIVLSALNKQEMVIKAFQMGIKSYLFKPLNPEDIFKKTIEILKPNF